MARCYTAYPRSCLVEAASWLAGFGTGAPCPQSSNGAPAALAVILMGIVGALVAMPGTVAAQDGSFPGPLLIPETEMGEFFVDDPQSGHGQGARKPEHAVPADIRAVLEYANRPFGETDIHEFCRAAELDREFGYRLGTHIEHEPVAMRVIADRLSRRDGRLFGHSTLQMGAYVGTVYVEVDLAGVQLPTGIAKDKALLVEGALGRNGFWSNLADACAINIVAAIVTLDGF